MGKIHSRPLAHFLALVALPITAAAAHPAPGRKIATTEDRFPAKIWSMSADGNVVTFSEDRGYPHDFPPLQVIFARNVASGTTVQISHGVNGTGPGWTRPTGGPAAERRVPGNGVDPHNAISADGRYVAFAQWMNLPRHDVVVYDLTAHTLRTASQGLDGAQPTGDSTAPSINADGRYVAFTSSASNLVIGDGNGETDVFVRDLVAGTTRLVSLSSDGRQGDGGSGAPAISADGRYVAFASDAGNLVGGDTDDSTDIFVRDLVAGTTRLVSRSRTGGPADGSSFGLAISATGRDVAFESAATNLVAGDTNGLTDVFVRDLRYGRTARVSVATGGHPQADGWSAVPAVSADGRYVSFTSAATNLVAGDTNGAADLFVRDRNYGRTYRVSLGAHGQADHDSRGGAMSPDARYVAFESAGTNLVAGDTNQVADVFRRDRFARVTLRVSLDTP
jgi:Tol biopolymer transport system component